MPTRPTTPPAALALIALAALAAAPARCDDVRLKLTDLVGADVCATANRLPTDVPLPALLNAAPLQLGNPLQREHTGQQPIKLEPGGNALPATPDRQFSHRQWECLM